MAELSPLIVDLALILGVAGILSILFKWLKQPVVLAYIVAGILLSFIITKTDPERENIQTWADIGIVFLLFGLGLEFSFKKLMKVGSTALIATMIIVPSMIGLGYLTGLCFGWPPMTCLFLGAMLSMSSTMIIVKVYNDLHLTKEKFSGIVLGILVIEDLVAVLLMVLLSTIAVSRHFEGMEMLYSLFKLITFLLFWFILGTYLIPTFLRKMKRFLNDEILLICSLALCLGMVYIATRSGFSAALGAFIMGSILAETLELERIEKMMLPIKNFFGAIFFVSVGMMIQVTELGKHIIPILIISIVIILGQILFSTIAVLIAGRDLKTAVCSGFSLTQIGEFSYIIGGLGIALGVIEESLFQIIVSASVITIFTAPFMVKLGVPAHRFLERKLPERWQSFLTKNICEDCLPNQDDLWKKLLQKLILNTFIFYTLSIAIVFFVLQKGTLLIRNYLPDFDGNWIVAIVVLLIIAPLLRIIIVSQDRSDEFRHLWNVNKRHRTSLIFTIIIRVVLCVGLIMYVLSSLFHTSLVIAFALALTIFFLFLASRRLRNITIRIENLFMENLNGRDEQEL